MAANGLLNGALRRAGVTRRAAAEALGITEMGLYRKIQGRTEFKASEIVRLGRLLKLPDEERDRIFLSEK